MHIRLTNQHFGQFHTTNGVAISNQEPSIARRKMDTEFFKNDKECPGHETEQTVDLTPSL